MKYYIHFLLSLVFAGALFVAPVQAQLVGDTGQDIGKQLHAAGQTGAGLGQPEDPRLIVATIIKRVLTLVGTIMFVLIVYGGYLWMTAGGNDEQVDKAKTTIRNAVIGLVIVLSSYAITIAVTNIALGRNVNSGAADGSEPLEGAIQNWFE